MSWCPASRTDLSPKMLTPCREARKAAPKTAPALDTSSTTALFHESRVIGLSTIVTSSRDRPRAPRSNQVVRWCQEAISPPFAPCPRFRSWALGTGSCALCVFDCDWCKKHSSRSSFSTRNRARSLATNRLGEKNGAGHNLLQRHRGAKRRLAPRLRALPAITDRSGQLWPPRPVDAFAAPSSQSPCVGNRDVV
jgi:hypothetical protein